VRVKLALDEKVVLHRVDRIREKVDIRLPGETPMAQGRTLRIISMIDWIRTSRLSIKNSLSGQDTKHKVYDQGFMVELIVEPMGRFAPSTPNPQPSTHSP